MTKWKIQSSNPVIFLLKINDIYFFKLIEYTIQYKFAKNKNDESTNKLTTSTLIS